MAFPLRLHQPLMHAVMPALVLALAAAGAQASSTAASSASDSIGTSVGALSHSFNRSSDSSSRQTVAQGDYKVIQVAQAANGEREVQLQAVPGTGAVGGFQLRVSDAVADQGGLVPGQVVRAEPRPYGVQFARTDTRRAFLLLLEDDWFRELQSVAIGT